MRQAGAGGEAVSGTKGTRVAKPRVSHSLSGDLNLHSERERKLNSRSCVWVERLLGQAAQSKRVPEVVWFALPERKRSRPDYLDLQLNYGGCVHVCVCVLKCY